MKLQKAFEIDTGKPIKQCRVVPVLLGEGKKAFLAAYSADFDVDPYVEMFFFPEDGLHLMLFDTAGQVLWKKNLGKGVLPGVWFCPVFAFDLDGDGVDEIYFVNNTDPSHPLGVSHYELAVLDAATGEQLRSIPWPHVDDGYGQCLGNQFRNFIVGGRVYGRPVLVCAQGTYEDMFLEGFDSNLELLWETKIAADSAGARGSHMCPVIDLNGDGVDEILWGERCISLENGRELFCADQDSYRGHSDIIQPVAWEDGSWRIFTCRESEGNVPPRICMYDATGNRLWGALERGHIDMGWAARLADGCKFLTMGVRIEGKVCGPDGRFHDQYEQFVFDPQTGETVTLPFDVYKTLPVDINGDGYHELVRGLPAADGLVMDRHGKSLGSVGGSVALSGKLLNRPGEQLLSYGADGVLRMWYDEQAKDSELACRRYENPFYQKALAVSGNGYHWCVLGGI